MKIKKILTQISVILLITLVSSKGYCQEEVEMIYPYFDLKYLKDGDNHRTLGARIYYQDEISEKPLPELNVRFYTNMEDRQLLGEAVSGKNGWARISIDDSVILPVDEANNWWFYAEYEGSDVVSMVSAEANVMDVSLDMVLSEDEGGARSVTITAYTTVDGEEVPVSGEEVTLFVPRMFSNLTIGSGALDESGQAIIDFTGDIPGDFEGNLTIVGGFTNHWQFANVEKRAITSWGVPASHSVSETDRELWTQIAPTWMVVTLTILLLGVWGHYLFAIISIVRIGRLGKKMKTIPGKK